MQSLTTTLAQRLDNTDALCIREFLDTEFSASSAHIVATVTEGEGTLTIGDGHQHITLDFPMSTAAECQASRKKLELLGSVVTLFIRSCRRQIE